MKNHILQSIIETAKYPTNMIGIAAMNQLIIEVASEFPEVIPAGFSFQEVRPVIGEPFYRYAMHAQLSDPWPLDEKAFCGTGFTVVETMESLRKALAAYFVPVSFDLIFEATEVRTASGELVPDRRTEYASAS